jgi:hypothetical protein
VHDWLNQSSWNKYGHAAKVTTNAPIYINEVLHYQFVHRKNQNTYFWDKPRSQQWNNQFWALYMTNQPSPFCQTFWYGSHSHSDRVCTRSGTAVQTASTFLKLKVIQRRAVYFRNCSGVLLVPVYNTLVDGRCNTDVQLCVVDWLLDGNGELVSLCDWCYRWDDVTKPQVASCLGSGGIPHALSVYQYS